MPPPWRRAALATAALWLASMAVVVVAAGTLPVRETVDVPADVGFAGWTAPAPDAAGAELLGSGLVRFDALWYLAIAGDGYPSTTDAPQAAAFFPGYPAVVAGLGAVLGGRLVLAAQLVSLLACVAALAGLQRLVVLLAAAGARHARDAHYADAHYADAHDTPGTRHDHDDHVDLARRTVLVTVLFPTAFFLVAPYAEALLLACGVWALVHAVRGRPWLAALLVAAATLTRPVGALLVVPLLLGVVARHEDAATHDDRGVRGLIAARGVPATGAVVALAGIALFGWLRWDDPLAVVHAQASWQRSLAAPWDSVVDAVLFAVSDLGAGLTGYHLLDLVVVGAAVGGAGVLVARRQWPLVAHAAANLLLWLAQVFPSRPLMSAPRFALVVPGVLAGLALVTGRRSVERVWLPVSAGLLALHLALFSRWWFVF